jgi:predicted RNase H-like HicB family nuclease
MKNYIALFEQGENGGYSVVFPDIPGVVTSGDNFDETLRMAHEALAFHAAGLQADGDQVPPPRTLEQIKAEWDDWAEWEADGDFIVVPVALIPTVQKSVRVDAMLPEFLISRIDAVAKNRSAFLTSAAEYLLDSGYKPSYAKRA